MMTGKPLPSTETPGQVQKLAIPFGHTRYQKFLNDVYEVLKGGVEGLDPQFWRSGQMTILMQTALRLAGVIEKEAEMNNQTMPVIPQHIKMFLDFYCVPMGVIKLAVKQKVLLL